MMKRTLVSLACCFFAWGCGDATEGDTQRTQGTDDGTVFGTTAAESFGADELAPDRSAPFGDVDDAGFVEAADQELTAKWSYVHKRFVRGGRETDWGGDLVGSGYVCGLGMVYGDLMRSGYFMSITQNSDASWELQGTASGSNSQTVGADAICYPTSAFRVRHNPYYVTHPPHYVYTNGGYYYISSWAGSRALILSSLQGRFGSKSTSTWITQSPSTSTYSSMHVRSGEYLWQQSLGFFVGEQVGPERPLRFIGPNGTGTFAQAGEYIINIGENSSKGIRMAKPKEGMCYITGVSGRFDAHDDWVQIYPDISLDSSHWNLYAHTSGDNGGVAVKAACLAMDQT